MELLVVVMILVVLAAIAVPVFMNQKAKAQDAAAQNNIAAVASVIKNGFSIGGAVVYEDNVVSYTSASGDSSVSDGGATVAVAAADDWCVTQSGGNAWFYMDQDASVPLPGMQLSCGGATTGGAGDVGEGNVALSVPEGSGSVQATGFTMNGLTPGDTEVREMSLFNPFNSDRTVTLGDVVATPTGDLNMVSTLRVTVSSSNGGVVLLNVPLSVLSGAELVAEARSKTVFTFAFSFPEPEESLCFASALQNGSFESPNVNPQSIVSTSTPGLVWRNTAENNVELWRTGFQGVPSADGNQFAEMNAFVAGTLYQDLPTVPGTTMRWRLKHRARAPGGAGGRDVMRVVIGSPAGSLVQSGIDLSDGAEWGSHTGTYTVPEGQTTTRFAFQAVSGHGPSYGNLLDDIVFEGEGCTTDPQIMSQYAASGVDLTMNVTSD